MHHVVAVLFSKYTMMDGNIQYLPERSRTGPARRYVSKQPMLELTLATAPADHYWRAVRPPGGAPRPGRWLFSLQRIVLHRCLVSCMTCALPPVRVRFRLQYRPSAHAIDRTPSRLLARLVAIAACERPTAQSQTIAGIRCCESGAARRCDPQFLEPRSWNKQDTKGPTALPA